jgi:hypothetical protein
VILGLVLIRESGGFVGNYETNEFDCLSRNVVCVRGTVDQQMAGVPNLVNTFRSLVDSCQYERD